MICDFPSNMIIKNKFLAHILTSDLITLIINPNNSRPARIRLPLKALQSADSKYRGTKLESC